MIIPNKVVYKRGRSHGTVPMAREPQCIVLAPKRRHLKEESVPAGHVYAGRAMKNGSTILKKCHRAVKGTPKYINEIKSAEALVN
jgi:hypothetical protein